MKGWPQRVPSLDEAAVILGVRTRIMAMHGLTSPYTTVVQIRDRIAKLHDAQRLKEAA